MRNPYPTSKKLMKGSRFTIITDSDVDAEGIDPSDLERLGVTTKPTRRPVASGVADVWVEVPLDELWMVAFRLSAEGHRPRVAELRVFPREDDWKKRPAGEWSARFQGLGAHAPRQGITKALLNRVPVNVVPKHLEALTRILEGETLDDIRPPAGEVASGEVVRRILKIIGVRHTEGEPVKSDPRGRKPDSDEFLAQVAAAYVEGLAESGRPTKHVQKVFGGSAGVAANRVARARRRGFLEEGLQGVISGDLTDKAKVVLARMRRKKSAKHNTATAGKGRRK